MGFAKYLFHQCMIMAYLNIHLGNIESDLWIDHLKGESGKLTQKPTHPNKDGKPIQIFR